MDKNVLSQAIVDQKKIFERDPGFVRRHVPANFISTKKVSVLSGVRRSGKSTLLKQISKQYKGYYYLNFEDDRLIGFSHGDFGALHETFLELYGEQDAFFFDEIQNVHGWEKFVRRLFDEGYKVFVTGSNAKLLSSELATALTGRHLKMELYPFSFAEFLALRGFTLKKQYDTREKAQIAKYLKEYLEYGGFPEIAKSKDKDELRQIYQDILIKDLIVRFGIKEIKAFKELSLYLMSNTASPASFNNLKKMLGFKSVTTVKNFVDHLEESYIHFSVSKYDYSLRKQMINDRKMYSVDTGLVNAVSFAFSENKGRLVENMVFMELKRRKKDIYYHREKHECDFVLREGKQIVEAIQVADNLSDPLAREREMNGLTEAMDKYSLRRGTILVFDGEAREMKIGNKKITVVPLWKWLLDPDLK